MVWEIVLKVVWKFLVGKVYREKSTVYGVQCKLYNVQYGSAPQFVEEAPVFLSLGSGTIC